MSLYAYCLSDEVTALALETIRGVAGATPILIEHEGLAAVVSDYVGDAVSVTRENVLAHERVVQQVLAQTTPLPFRFGTLVSEARLRNYLTTQKSALCTQLARVRGCVEMSVKVIRDKEAFESESTGQDSTTRWEPMAGEPVERSQERAEEIAGWLAERLASTVRESVVSVRPQEMLSVAAAYLVEVARLEEYRERLRRARDERREIHFLTSGPWPPYSFSSISS